MRPGKSAICKAGVLAKVGLLTVLAACSGAHVSGGANVPPESSVPTGASTTAPVAAGVAPSESLRLAIKGDFGNGSSDQTKITQRMCDWRASTGFSLVITTGDNIYDPDGNATDRNY